MNFSILCIFFSISSWYVFTTDHDTVEIGFKILNEQSRKDNSLCLFSRTDSSLDDISSLSKKIKRALDLPDIDEDIRESSKSIIRKYRQYNINNDHIVNILIEYFLKESCEMISEKNDSISKHVYLKLRAKKALLKIETCHEILAVACQAETMIIDQKAFLNNTDIKSKEQRIINVIYYNDIMRKLIGKITENTSWDTLIEESRELINMISIVGLLPSYYLINCYILRAEDFYLRNKMTYIETGYLTMIENLEKKQTCEISLLDETEYGYLEESIDINSQMDEIDREAVMYGFEMFFKSLSTTNVLNNYEKILNISGFWTKNDCRYNSRLNNNYTKTIESISDSYYAGKISCVAEYVAIICILSDVKNNDNYESDILLNNKMTNIIEIYAYIIDSFNDDKRQEFGFWSYMIMDIIRSDSERVDEYLKGGFKNQQRFLCLLRSYQNLPKDHLIPKLKFLLDFVLNQYTFTYCTSKMIDVTQFSKEISEFLIGVRNDELLTFDHIHTIMEKILDKSVTNIEVTWKGIFVLVDTCQLNPKISYSSIPFEQTIQNIHSDIKLFKSYIKNKCSRILSTTKYLEEFNNPLLAPDQNLVISTALKLKRNSSFNHLDLEDKFNTFKNEIANSSISYSKSQGRRERLECESRKLITIVPNLDDELIRSIFISISSGFLDHDTCMYKNDTFDNDNRQNLINFIQKHPDFSITPIYFINYFISQFPILVSTVKINLTSPISSEDLITKLISPSTCSIDDSDINLNNFYDKNFEYLYRGTVWNWKQYVKILKCREIKKVKSYSQSLTNKNNLSGEEHEIIEELYKNITTAKPELKEKNMEKLIIIFEEMKDDIKFKPIKENILKESIAKCYTTNIHFAVEPIQDTDNEIQRNRGISDKAIILIIIGGVTLIIILISGGMFIYRWVNRLKK